MNLVLVKSLVLIFQEISPLLMERCKTGSVNETPRPMCFNPEQEGPSLRVRVAVDVAPQSLISLAENVSRSPDKKVVFL